MKANPRTVVRGKAGTGKTVIAVDRAMQLSKEGKRVLYLCFNQLLAHHIRESLAKMPEAQKFSVLHVHALYHDAITRAGMLEQLSQADTDEQTLYGVKFPRLFVDAMLDLDALPWDALIVDEAQDLLTPDNLDAFDLLLAGGLNEGCWHFFLDPLQNIYGTEVQDNVDVRLKAAQPAYEDLFENCRNTRQVAVQASITSGIDLALEGAPDGPECGHVFFNGFDSFKSKIVELIEHWRKEDIRPEDIAILSTRRRANSLLKEMTHISGIPVVEALSASKGQIAFSTMHGFKGLERRAVIAIDMDEIGQAGWSMLHYTGLSRARTLLKAFVPESRRGAYAGLASDYAQKLRSS